MVLLEYLKLGDSYIEALPSDRMVSFNSKLVLHYGTPDGLFRPRVFGDFARGKVVAKLDEMGLSGPCEVLNDGDRTIYNYPRADIGLVYVPISAERCEVGLIGAPDNLTPLLAFLLEETHRQ